MPARFYINKKLWESNILSGEEAHHAIKVMRLKVGSAIEIFDGEGDYARAEVSQINGKQLSFQVLEKKSSARPKPLIHLYQAIPKGKNMELIIQKAVELGVSEIHPIITDHTIAINGDLKKKTEKWQRISLEACKQCRQTWLPLIHEPVHISTLGSCPQEIKVVGALRKEAVSLKDTLTQDGAPESVALLVGPEGDFTDLELEQAFSLGFTPVTLGELVLRVETATLYLISAVKYQLG